MTNMMKNLPTVISCCFCCFLRAGSVMIGLTTFIIGVIFAPNVSTSGAWNLQTVLGYEGRGVEVVIQFILGLVSIALCIISLLLIVGSLCNVPSLLTIYQWGMLAYASIVTVCFFVLSMYCFMVYTNALTAGGILLSLIFIGGLTAAYFIIVVNSLKVSMKFLSSDLMEV